MNYLENKVKEILTNFNGRNIIEELLPKTEFYSLDTYGKFESSIYKDIKPKDYFKSEEWTEKFKEIITHSNLSVNFKQEVADQVNNFFDSELKFFGDADIIENFKNKNQALILGMFSELNRRLLTEINDTYDIDDFDEALDQVLYTEFGHHNKLSVENLYPEKIKLYYNTSNSNYIDETFLYAEEGLLKLTSENISLLNRITTKEELKEVLTLNKRDYEKDLNEQISEGYESYSEVTSSEKKEFIKFTDIYNAVVSSQHGYYPVVYIETSYKELSSLRNKNINGRDLENASLILIESKENKPNVINLGKLNSFKVNLDPVKEESDFLERFDLKYIENQLGNKEKNSLKLKR